MYPVCTNVTVFPGAILPTGTYSLTMIGINWGGPSSYKVAVTTDGTTKNYSGGGNSTVGANWTQTISIAVVNGQ